MKKKLLPLAMLAGLAGNADDRRKHKGPPANKWSTMPEPAQMIYPFEWFNPEPRIGFDRSREGYIEVIEEGEGVGTEVAEYNLYLSPAGSTKAEWI